MQTKLYSLLESVANILIGSIVALLSQLVIFPLFSIHISIQANIEITLWFTLISIIRSYFVRRGFNWIHTHTRWH